MRRGSRCVDVVHEQNRALERLSGKSVSDIPAPLEAREPALPARPTDPGKEGLAGQLPPFRERPRELLRRVVAALEAAFAVGRHKGDDIDVRARQPLGDDVRRHGSEPAETALLPTAHDPAHVVVVDHGRSCLCEAKPSARAFAAARNRPRRRGAAARAQRRRQGRQPCAASRAEKRSCGITDEAAPRE